jgi:uroporphyrinogen decarboxylase
MNGETPPYVPWSFSFTHEAHAKLLSHYGEAQLHANVLQNHLLGLGAAEGFFEPIGNDQFRDIFGVVWDRSIDKDIGNVVNCVLPEPSMKDYTFPDPYSPIIFDNVTTTIEMHQDLYRVFAIGFSLYERAWTLRGMATLMEDFLVDPDFVHDLFNAIGDWNIAVVKKALEYDIDCVYFGDDWGQQTGLQMGQDLWREFIRPVLKRMYGTVRDAGKHVMIHSCGKVDEVFDDLVDIGLTCFNPFQPEVMDVYALLQKYRRRLAFHGGLSTQKTLSFGDPGTVRAETRKLLAAGREGGYIFAPAHAVEGDVPLENMLVFIEEVQKQAGFKAA